MKKKYTEVQSLLHTRKESSSGKQPGCASCKAPLGSAEQKHGVGGWCRKTDIKERMKKWLLKIFNIESNLIVFLQKNATILDYLKTYYLKL